MDDVFFFDCDKTLYGYDFRKRLPALARMSGVSQYRLARDWWVAGYERRAESGEWTDGDDYLAAFDRVTGGSLTRDQWAVSRAAAMTPIAGSLDALGRAAELGRVSLLSNNPSLFADVFARLAPEAAAILGDGAPLVSARLGARKPSPEVYERALDALGTTPEHAFFADDSAANIAAAADLGITAHHFTGDTTALRAAVEAFAAR